MGDKRRLAVFAAAALIAALGLAVYYAPLDYPKPPAPGASVTKPGDEAPAIQDDHVPAGVSRQVHQRFQQAVAMLHAKKFDLAVSALHDVLRLAPRLPEAHVNMGFAMLGLRRHKAARDFFNTAIDLRPSQFNAYYGLALAYEGMGDGEMAAGSMRTYIHLAPPEDPYVEKARRFVEKLRPTERSIKPETGME